MMSIQTNYNSLVAQNALTKSNSAMGTAMERLSTGLRINSASDDAAGLQIANRLEAQTRGMNVAMRNSQDAIGMMQTAEGAMDELTNIAYRMKDLSTQAANGTNGADDRAAMDAEFQELGKEAARILNDTSYGSGDALLVNGKFDGDVTFQIGASSSETLTVNIGDELNNIADGFSELGGIGYKSEDGFSLTYKDANDNFATIAIAESTPGEFVVTRDTVDAAGGTVGAQEFLQLGGGWGATAPVTPLTQAEMEDGMDAEMSAITRLQMDSMDSILGDIGSGRSSLGANINRLEHTISNLSNISENTEAAKGRIMDTDFAVETANMTKNQLLVQAGTNILAQSNQMGGMVMGLL
ncbi:flagellin [Ferrimonas pelagia]|uniref:Flagellin n=1 Tax=Ferrimonas pelagia TaxID=1177826 RepID=A0ABP9EAV1_9GAMM